MNALTIFIVRLAFIMLLVTALSPATRAERMDNYQIGGHGQANIHYPAWFKESFLDLREDLGEARKQGKRGIIVFFSQKQCSHCKAFIETTLKDSATQQRVRKHYDIVVLDIFSDLEITDIDGSVTTVRDFADQQRARLTPTLLFYGVEKARLLKIIGFYPPEKFNKVLDYIDGGHFKQVTLSQYLRGKSPTMAALGKSLTPDSPFFAKPPYRLDRRNAKGAQPLLVVFDNADCTPCERFHRRVLGDSDVRRLMSKFEAVRLNMSDDVTRLTVPDGRELTPRQWSGELQLGYDIAVVFFDDQGQEVHRLDAETGRDRMTGSMQYVLEKAYTRHEQFLRWRRENAIKKRQAGEK